MERNILFDPKFNRLLRACVFAAMNSRRVNNINTFFQSQKYHWYVSRRTNTTLKLYELHIKRDCANIYPLDYVSLVLYLLYSMANIKWSHTQNVLLLVCKYCAEYFILFVFFFFNGCFFFHVDRIGAVARISGDTHTRSTTDMKSSIFFAHIIYLFVWIIII